MKELFLFTVLGLGGGALTAALALGVVLSYRGSGTINLATAAVAILAAYLFAGLRTGGYITTPTLPFVPHRIDLGAPLATVPAVIVTLALCALTGGVLEFVVVRPLRSATPLAKLVASLGVLLVIQAMVVIRFGTDALASPAVLPQDPVDVLGVGVPDDRFILVAIVALATGVLAATYRYTRFGLATRATAESEPFATLAGLSANEISLVNTVVASVLTGALGILVAPLAQVDPSQMLTLVVPALAAALLARFTSFTVAAVCGLGLGILQSLLFYFQTKSWFPTSGGEAMPGVYELLVFLSIVAAMFARGDALPRRGVLIEQRLPEAPRARRIALPAVGLSAVCVVALVALPFDYRQALVLSLIAIVIALSFTVITGFVGQISLLPMALAGIAGFVLSKLSVHLGIGFPLGPAIAVAAATAFGVATAASALRVRGVNLAVVTLAAAVAIQEFVFNNPTWGAGHTGAPVASPHLLRLNLGPNSDFFLGDGKLPSPVLGFLVLAFAVACCVLVANLRRANLGQRMLAVRSNERAAAAAGIHVRNVKFAAFAISSAIAGLAGVLYAYNFGSVTADRFGIATALAFVAFVYVGGITTVLGAVIAGLIATEALVSHAIDHWFGVPQEYTLLVAGVLLVFNVVLNPGGIAASITRAVRGRRDARRPPDAVRAPATAPTTAAGSGP
jgi:branched-chain amino acid transport system permease protein